MCKGRREGRGRFVRKEGGKRKMCKGRREGRGRCVREGGREEEDV